LQIIRGAAEISEMMANTSKEKCQWKEVTVEKENGIRKKNKT
jgi:hypothetical protein